MATVIDPVCDMKVVEEHARDNGLTTTYEGQTFSFCSQECKEKFEKNPIEYLTGKETPEYQQHK